MMQYLLALCREYALPIPRHGRSRFRSTSTRWAACWRTPDLVFKSDLLPAESATVARLTREEAS
jgi:hypothetical protein